MSGTIQPVIVGAINCAGSYYLTLPSITSQAIEITERHVEDFVTSGSVRVLLDARNGTSPLSNGNVTGGGCGAGWTTFYINGVAGTPSATAAFWAQAKPGQWNRHYYAATSTFTSATVIGASFAGSFPWPNNISLVRIYSTALTAEEIALRARNIDTPEIVAKIAAEYKFTDWTGTTVTDSSGNARHATLSSATAWCDQAPWAPRGAQQNRNIYSNTLSNAAWSRSGVSPIVNSGDTPPTGATAAWRVIEDTSTGFHYFNQDIIATAITPSGTRLRCGVLVKAGVGRDWIIVAGSASASQAYFNLSTGAFGNTTSIFDKGSVSLGDGWYYVWIEYSSNGAASHSYLFIAESNGDGSFTGNGTNYVLCAGISLQTATIQLTPAVIETTTAPAYYTSPVAMPKQNLLAYSGDPSASSWSKSNLSAALFSASGGPGGAAEYRLTENSSNSTHLISQTSADVANRKNLRTVFVRAKAETRSWVVLTCDGANQGAYFDVSTGTIGTTFFQSGSGGYAFIESLGDGYYLCAIVCNIDVTGSAATAVYMASGNGGITYQGDGTSSLLVSGVQAANVIGTTPYIETPTAALSAGAPRGQIGTQNLAPESNTLNSATWVKNVCTVDASPVTGPNGELDAWVVREADSGVSSHYLGGTTYPLASPSSPAGSLIAGRVYTLQMDVKAGTLDDVVLRMGGAYVWFDCTTKLFSFPTSLVLNTGYEDLPNGFTRIRMTFTSAGAEAFLLMLAPSAGSSVSAGSTANYMTFANISLHTGYGIAEHAATTTVAVNTGAPRGVASGLAARSWTPNEIASCTAWWSADLRSIELDASGRAVTWANQRNGANITPFSNSTAAARPTYAATGINSNPALLFGGSHGMSGPAGSSLFSVSSGVFYVLWRPTAFSNNSGTLYANDAIVADTGSAAFGLFGRASTPRFYSYNYDGTQDSSPTTAAAVDTTYVLRWRHISGSLYLRVNSDAESAPVSSGNTSSLANAVSLCQGYDALHFATGYMARLVFLSSDPTTAEDARIMAWLNAYGGL